MENSAAGTKAPPSTANFANYSCSRDDEAKGASRLYPDSVSD